MIDFAFGFAGRQGEKLQESRNQDTQDGSVVGNPRISQSPISKAAATSMQAPDDRSRADLSNRTGFFFLKRSMDIFISIIGMVLLSPVLLVAAVSVKATSPGPVIFKQQRFGKDQKLFVMYKFRTMKVGTPSDIPTSERIGEKRYLTPLGLALRKSSIDELPQLVNVLKGDMSIIGPRPVILKEKAQIVEREKYGANDIRPGLTGIAQINGRDGVDMKQKARMDGFYRNHLSAELDFTCFLKTFGVVLTGKGFGDAIALKKANGGGDVARKSDAKPDLPEGDDSSSEKGRVA